MYPNSIHIGLKVVLQVLWGKVFTVWVHGPLGISTQVFTVGVLLMVLGKILLILGRKN